MIKGNQKGVALVSALALMSIILLLGSAILYTSQVEGVRAFRHENRTEAYYVAKSAADSIIASLTTQKENNLDFFDQVFTMENNTAISSSNSNIAGGSATIVLRRVSEVEYVLTSTGYVDGTSETVTAYLDFTPNGSVPFFDHAMFANHSYDARSSYVWGSLGSNGTVQAGLNNTETRVCDLGSFPTCTYVSDYSDHFVNNIGRELELIEESDIPASPYLGTVTSKKLYIYDEGTYNDFNAEGSLKIYTSGISGDSFDIVVNGDAIFRSCSVEIYGGKPVNFYIRGNLDFSQSHTRIDSPSQLRFYVLGEQVSIRRLDELKMYIYAPTSTVMLDPNVNAWGSNLTIEGAIVADTLDIRDTINMRYVEPDFYGGIPIGNPTPPGGDFSVNHWE